MTRVSVSRTMPEPELRTAATPVAAEECDVVAQLECWDSAAVRQTCASAQDGRLGGVHLLFSTHHVPFLQFP